MAVRPPEEVLDAIALRVAGAAGALVGGRWAGRDRWHVTLQFLGAVADVAAVREALGRAAAGRAPFRARLGAAGAFPKPGRANVVWLGAAEGEDGLGDLAAGVAAALGPLRYPVETRPFRPHLTVARLRNPVDVRPVLATLGPGPVGPAWTVEEVVLYESRLSPAGPTYTALARAPLGSGVTSPG